MSNYLIDQGGGAAERAAEVLAVPRNGHGEGGKNWDAAVRSHYSYDGVDDLQDKWIESLRKQPPGGEGESGGQAAERRRDGQPRGEDETRDTARLGVPQLEPPVVNAIRGASPVAGMICPARRSAAPSRRPSPQQQDAGDPRCSCRRKSPSASERNETRAGRGTGSPGPTPARVFRTGSVVEDHFARAGVSIWRMTSRRVEARTNRMLPSAMATFAPPVWNE